MKIKSTLKKMLTLCLIAVLVTTLTVSCDSDKKNNSDASDTKVENVALILPGSISDQSFNYSAYLGLQEIEKLGYEVSYTENVGDNDIESVCRTYANDDYELIIGNGYQFVDPFLTVAPDYPQKYFYVYGSAPSDVADEDLPKNIAFSYNKEYEGAYVCGAMAALESESGVVGFIGAAPSNPQIANVNAFRDGAQSINPNIEVKIIMTGTFIDPPVGREAAITLIEQGCDVLMHNADATGTGVIDACVERNVKVIGYGGDQLDLAPNQLLTCLGVNTAKCISDQMMKIEENSFSGVQRDGLAEEIIYMTTYGEAASQESVVMCKKIVDDISDGSLVLEEKATEY